MSGHRCLADRDCRRADTTDGHRQGAATEKPDTLCPPCLTHMTSAIEQLPADWAELRDALGEHTASTGQKIRSTPTPAIPISTRKEALMAAIADMADRAAAIVSDALHTGQPATYHGRGYPGHHLHAVTTSVALTAPNINLLALAPPEDALVWTKPRRCNPHYDLIRLAEDMLETATDPDEKQAAENALRLAYTAAGGCDDCNGWGRWGQERELTTMTGLQILLDLVDLHHQTRAEIGLTKLRHVYTMPCPDCGSRVFRNDGESIVICEGDNTHTCTEREYKVRAGLRLEEEMYTKMGEYLLAEGYWRLDRMQKLIDNMSKAPEIDLPGAGTLVLEKLQAILTDGAEINGKPIGHLPPAKRAAGTDRKAALQRQVDEDNWTWRNEKPWRPPKPKARKKASRPAGAPTIHPSSLTTLIDHDDEITGGRPTNLCTIEGCNMVHAGDCP